jgi:hypothetical protein
MTVRRSNCKFFPEDRISIAHAVRNILNQYPPYRNTAEPIKDSRFITNVKPSWWFLGTDMVVTVEVSESGTLVTVNTISQPYIIGDIFHFYDQYINDFF